MSVSFSVGARAILPIVVTDFESVRPINSVFNPVIGGGMAAAAYPAGLRTGSMTAIFSTLAAAQDFDSMLAGVAPITYTDTSAGLTFVFLADQEIRITRGDDLVQLDGDDTYLQAVAFAFQEVTV